MTEHFDVVVVGSGAGGAPVAYELANVGASVLVLEKGPRYSPATDFLHDEVSSCRRDQFVPFPADDPHTLRRSASATAFSTNSGWTSRCVGGGTVHMSGFFFRLPEVDFRMASELGPVSGSTLQDWPLAYEELAPFYDRIEAELGVSGDVSNNPFEPPRKGAFPFPPVQTHPVASWIDERSRAVGLHSYPTPRAIITKAMEGRLACHYCALCGSYGCEVNAKSSTLASLLPAAERTGRCEIRPESMVFDLPIAMSGMIKGARYIDREGVIRTVHADRVVVAGSAIESARLLLLSRSRRFPHGLGNQNGQVGRNLSFSTLTKMEGFLTQDVLPSDLDLADPAPFVGRALQDGLTRQDELPGTGRPGTMHLLWAHPNPIFAAERLIRDSGRLVFGEELMKRLHHRFRDGRMLEIEGFSDWLPTPGTRIDLDPSVKDQWGLPAARITIDRHPADRAVSERLQTMMQNVLQALEAQDIETLSVGGETWVLQQGSCRMGTDPAESVCDRFGKVHEIPNLYVTDGAALPFSGAVPCTETIAANALRIGAHLAELS